LGSAIPGPTGTTDRRLLVDDDDDDGDDDLDPASRIENFGILSNKWWFP
jgi:hypothetical protein